MRKVDGNSNESCTMQKTNSLWFIGIGSRVTVAHPSTRGALWVFHRLLLLGLRDLDLNVLEEIAQLADVLMEDGEQTFFAFVVLPGQSDQGPDLEVSAHRVSLLIHNVDPQTYNPDPQSGMLWFCWHPGARPGARDSLRVKGGPSSGEAAGDPCASPTLSGTVRALAFASRRPLPSSTVHGSSSRASVPLGGALREGP